MGSISPQSYESAAKECYDLSEKFQTVYNSLQTVLLETSAMAGGYQAVKTWAKAYDDRAAAVTLVATSFAQALQHFGDILTAAGYNWKCGEYKANRDPNKGDPPSLPGGFPSELPYGPGTVTGVASSGTYSRGLETDWTELQDKVTALVAGGEVPDGDTDKLARAATAWRTFAQSDPVYGGKARLLMVASGLERGYGSDVPDDIPNLTVHLRTLATSIGDIEAAARDIAAAVDAHKVALTTMRSDMNTQFAMVVVVTAIQIGTSMVRVKEPPTKQKTPSKQQTPSERQEEIDFLNQAAGALAGPANTFLTALSGFTFTTAVLTTGGLPTIIGLPILTTDPEQGRVPTKEGKSEIPPKDRYSGGLVKVNKPDPDADKLAERIGGESRVKYKNDPSGREFDAVSDEYVAQAKPANFAGNKKFRSQARATFEAAEANDKKVYYHFDGPPSDDVIRTLRRYSDEYGVEVVIDTDPL
ncbi:restriction endonuclease fold toxin [Nocardia fluminea]|uniref:restriction endonuclease fold toxin n=1 Tax=Nocardia fluminea TaxID=134984 RepID=UPI003827218D